MYNLTPEIDVSKGSCGKQCIFLYLQHTETQIWGSAFP